ncbi:hypothetical protein QFC21_001286 [Naganishia friedmannii]|uniref:Uncharacterized protein n=1 Tax=Naganishia friedmannii TaxID=89922 RepID=A0ACC2W4C9_9TREE|nr:hypothetical protein QFC21_001286 [Naganishia friedmannii]
MYDEHGRDSLAPARVVEGYTFPAPAAPSSPSAQDVHPFDSNPSLPHVSPSHVIELLFDSQHNPHRQLAPLTTGDWVVHVASFKDDAEDNTTDCEADNEVRFARIGKSYQDGEHGARPESPNFVACQTPPSPCTLLTTCGSSLFDTTSTPERSHQDEQQQQRDPNSLQYQADTMSQHVPPTLLPRAQLHRRRSSQKTALELIVEDPVGTSEMLESLERCPLRPEEEPPHANGISDTTTTAANSVPSRQGGRAPRRAFSLSDIARHSSDSLLHRDAATTALESSAIGDPEGNPSIASALEPISKLSTESGRQSVSAPIASAAEDQLAPVSKGSQHGDSVQLKASVDEELHGPSNIDVQQKSSSFSKSSASKLHPRTIAVKAASPDALASIFETSRRPDEPALQLVTNEIVAYNPRFPHPIVLYAALSGRDTDLSAYFDENGMFADTLHRRVGAGGRQILLQNGEKVTFPNVNDEAACARQDTEKHSKRQSVSNIGDGRAGESRGQEGVEGFLWEDDHVLVTALHQA